MTSSQIKYQKGYVKSCQPKNTTTIFQHYFLRFQKDICPRAPSDGYYWGVLHKKNINTFRYVKTLYIQQICSHTRSQKATLVMHSVCHERNLTIGSQRVSLKCQYRTKTTLMIKRTNKCYHLSKKKKQTNKCYQQNNV